MAAVGPGKVDGSSADVHIERSSAAPVTPVSAIHESLVDQIAAEGGMIGVEAPQHLVDGGFGIDAAGLEGLSQPIQYRQALGPPGRDGGQPAARDEATDDRIAGGVGRHGYRSLFVKLPAPTPFPHPPSNRCLGLVLIRITTLSLAGQNPVGQNPCRHDRHTPSVG